MTISYNHLQAFIHVGAVVRNFRKLNELAGNCCPIIKADAYGHGMAVLGEALSGAGAQTLAAGTVAETCELRRTSFTGRLISLLGPQVEEDFEACAVHRITPFVSRREQLVRLQAVAARRGETISIALKFDTGMARLGFTLQDVGDVLDALRDAPGLEVAVVASHLATADDPAQEAFVREQGACFAQVVAALRQAGLSFEATLVNSAGLLGFEDLRHELQRPGIALYGANPWYGTDRQELGAFLVPAMEVRTRVYQVHPLRTGETIHYGRTFTARRDMTVAIVGAGYADNYSRGLSNKGAMTVLGRRAPVVGRVCMQLCALDVTDIVGEGLGVRAGDDAWILGGPGDEAVRAEELADWWGTITYEVFCLLGQNQREYILDSV